MSTTPSPSPEQHPPPREGAHAEQDLSHTAPPAEWVRWAILVLSLLTAGAAWLAWQSQGRVQTLEQELVKRQQGSQTQAMEAQLLSRQAQELARESAARLAIMENRLAEGALHRSQIEDLIKTLNSSRDENLLADIETSLRVAAQQAALTGSAEPLVIALQSADDRLGRAAQPRLDNVRRAIAKDLDQVRATRVADLSVLAIRLDEATRLVDELPLLNSPQVERVDTSNTKATRPNRNSVGGSSSTTTSPEADNWTTQALHSLHAIGQRVWAETRSLIRVTEIKRPEGMLISPEQSFFLRENMKLRLLNARLALLSRQTTLARDDLQQLEALLPRYFDTKSRKTQLLQAMMLDVAKQSSQTTVPRPDDTLAALAVMTAGR